MKSVKAQNLELLADYVEPFRGFLGKERIVAICNMCNRDCMSRIFSVFLVFCYMRRIFERGIRSRNETG